MKKYKYQHGFSKDHTDEMYDTKKRTQKAKKTLSIIFDYLTKEKKNPKKLKLLDIGCSTGFMTRFYSEKFMKVIAIDIDKEAVQYALRNNSSENIEYFVSDSMNMGFEDESFDVITCTHIYEHVPDARRLMSEIHRLLKIGGICYFAAGNRLNLIEGHYRLPLLSVIPKSLAHLYLRILGKGTYYYENHLTFWGLKKLVSSFEIEDYTLEIIGDPKKYHAEEMIRPNSAKQKIYLAILKIAYFISPTYIWVLRKNSRP